MVLHLTDYDEEDGELPDEKHAEAEQPSAAEINDLSDKLGKVMEEGGVKESNAEKPAEEGEVSDTEEGEMKDSDVEDGEIKEEGEEGEILSDDEVRG